MNIQAKKLDLIEWISKLNDISIIEQLKQVMDDYSKSSKLQDKSKEIELESINRGLKDLDDGKVYSHNTARKIYERYL